MTFDPFSTVSNAVTSAARQRGWMVTGVDWDKAREQYRVRVVARTGERVTVRTGIADPTTAIIDALPKR